MGEDIQVCMFGKIVFVCVSTMQCRVLCCFMIIVQGSCRDGDKKGKFARRKICKENLMLLVHCYHVIISFAKKNSNLHLPSSYNFLG